MESMRLFIAITFDEELKDELYQVVELLKLTSQRGSFTQKDNLHLTVNFIGETKRLEEVKRAMRKAVSLANITEFELVPKGFGSFKRNEGDIYWLGIEPNHDLNKLQKSLVQELREAGFYDIDDREYRPHLTLGRRIRTTNCFNPKEFEEKLKPMHQKVTKICLMKSERINGKLTYTEIYHVELDKI